MEKLLLIDGHSILSRAYYGIPLLSTASGLHTNAVYGFLNIMFKCIDDEKADYIAVAFDLERSRLLRTQKYPAYKGTRRPMPSELLEQVPLMQRVLEAMRIPILTLEGYEADDILGTMAKRANETALMLPSFPVIGIFFSCVMSTLRYRCLKHPADGQKCSTIIRRMSCRNTG